MPVEFQPKLAEPVVVKVLQLLQLAVLALPVLPVIYLQYWQDPALRFVNYGFHEAAIFFAILEGAGVSYVSWLSYLRSGNVLLKRLTQAFIGFTVVYSMHGIFTPIADHHMPLFLLYGPISRLVMASCLLLAMLSVKRPADSVDERADARQWLRWLYFLLVINIFVALIAYSPMAQERWVRPLPESLAGGCNLAALFMLYRLPLRSPLMQHFGMATVWFAVASLAFALSSPWNHQWWLAHGLSAAGFSILGYGILKAFQTKHAMDRVFTAEELFEDLAATNGRLRDSMAELASANVSLTRQAADLDRVNGEFSDLLNLSPDGVLVVNGGGNIIKVNAAAEKLFGYPKDGMQGISVEELIPANLRPDHKRARQLHKHLPNVRAMGVTGNALNCLRIDGSTFLAHISIGNLRYADADCMATFIRETNAERAHFEYLRLLDQADIERGVLLRSVLADLPRMFFELQRQPDGRFRCWSFSTAALNGMHIEQDQSDEQKTQQLFNQIVPADLPSLFETIERAAQTQSVWQAQWEYHVYGQGLQRLQAIANKPRTLPNGGLAWLCTVDILKETRQ